MIALGPFFMSTRGRVSHIIKASILTIPLVSALLTAIALGWSILDDFRSDHAPAPFPQTGTAQVMATRAYCFPCKRSDTYSAILSSDEHELGTLQMMFIVK